MAWPWTAAAWAALGRSEFPALLSLAGWTLLAAWFGRTQFERNLRFDAVAAQATPQTNGVSTMQAAAEAFYRFPARWLRDPMAAIVEKELRSLARTPRYRMVFVMGFSFGLMVWLPMILGDRADRHPELSRHFLTVVCVYALTLLGQVSFWNCFGFDRSATLIYFAAPQPLVKTFAAKNVAALVFIYLEVVILVGVTTLFGVSPGAAQLLETVLVIAVCSLYMLALGNISSVQYPRGLNPERVSQGGASSRFQALIMLLYPVSLLPVLLAYVARYALRQRTGVLPGAGVRGGGGRNAVLDCDGIGGLDRGEVSASGSCRIFPTQTGRSRAIERASLLFASAASGGRRQIDTGRLQGGLRADVFQFGCLAGCPADAVEDEEAHRILHAHASQGYAAILQDAGDSLVGTLVLLPDADIVADFDQFAGAHLFEAGQDPGGSPVWVKTTAKVRSLRPQRTPVRYIMAGPDSSTTARRPNSFMASCNLAMRAR